MAEAFRSHVVWVRNIGYPVGCQIVGHALDLVRVFHRRGQVHQVFIVLVVHGYDQVEVKEIHRPYPTGGVSHGEPSVEGRRAHAAVWKTARMTSVCTCRIRLNPVLKPRFADIMFKNCLRRRRTADIT